MKIVYAVTGSRGDTQPHVAFAVELARAGHQVRLHIPPDYGELVPNVNGISLHCCKRSFASCAEEIAPHVASGNMDATMKALFENQAEFFTEDANEVKAVCEGWADILIFNHTLGHIAYAVTEVLKIKCLYANVQPMLPTREVFLMGGNMQLPKFLHLFFWWLLLSKLAMPEVLEQAIGRWKAANGCKLPPLKGWEITYRFNTPSIFGFSPASFAPPKDWEAFDHAITGDWVLSADDFPEKPEAALLSFLKAAKEPPLYLGWGSMANESGQYMTELAVRALKAIGKRGVVFAGSNGSELFRLGLEKLDASKPDAAEVLAWAQRNVLVTAGVSHEWLFPKVAAVVHHGGAGTSAACFRSGVPSIVTPFNFDQFEYSRLSVEHGLGPGPLPPFKDVTPEQLGTALLEAIKEPRYTVAAKALREQMHRERGTKLAVDAFHDLCHRDIWKEDAERQARGVAFALEPPTFLCGFLERKQARSTVNPATLTKRASLGQLPAHQQKLLTSHHGSLSPAA